MRPAARGSIVRIFKRLRARSREAGEPRRRRHGGAPCPRVTDIFWASRQRNHLTASTIFFFSHRPALLARHFLSGLTCFPKHVNLCTAGEGKSREEDVVSSSKPENSSPDPWSMSARFSLSPSKTSRKTLTGWKIAISRIPDVTGAFF